VKNPIVLWARPFAVTNSVYNAVAYIENQNDAAMQSLPYEFRLYDDKGLFISRREGTALIPPSGRYAIVETGIAVGTSTVTRATITFSDSLSPWQRVPETIKALRAPITDVKMENDLVAPRLQATITNPSPIATLTDTVVTAVLYDDTDTAIGASRTIVHTLAPGANDTIFFTWPTPFVKKVVRYDVTPVIDVFAVNQ
jgi:hypothetical protein